MSGIITASDDAAEKILGILDAEEAKQATAQPVNEPASTPEPEQTAEAPQAEAQEEASPDPEPSAPPVEPPASWSAEDKAKFAALPPDAQAVIATRERERDLALRRGQDEIAQARKAAEAERLAIQTERQRYADQLSLMAQRAQQFDPILAEAQKTDWIKLSQEDPASYVQKWAAYQHRLTELRHIETEQARVREQYLATKLAEENAKLAEMLPEWKDEAKRAETAKALTEYLVKSGFSKEEVAQAADSRALVLAHKARLYDQMMSQQANIQSKKVAPVPPKPASRPLGKNDDTSKASDAALKRIRGASNDRDRAAAIASIL